MKKLTLKNRDLLAMSDLSTPEIELILKTARTIKKNPKKYASALKGKNLGMIFQKPSTRTRVSFEVAMYQLGGQALNLTSNELQLKRGETVADTARVLSRFLDAMTARVFSHNDVLAYKYGPSRSSTPCPTTTPCQALADVLTILEHKKPSRTKSPTSGTATMWPFAVLAVVQLGGYIEVATPKAMDVIRSLPHLKIGKQTDGKLVVLQRPGHGCPSRCHLCRCPTSMGQERSTKAPGRFQGFQITPTCGPGQEGLHCHHCRPIGARR